MHAAPLSATRPLSEQCHRSPRPATGGRGAKLAHAEVHQHLRIDAHDLGDELEARVGKALVT
jgi:hypothetical protein